MRPLTVRLLQDVESDAMLTTLGRYRVSLVTVAYDSPQSLTAAVAKWDANGLLELVRGAFGSVMISACLRYFGGSLCWCRARLAPLLAGARWTTR